MRKYVKWAGALSLVAACFGPSAAFASSHREAPFIAQNPKVDNTDFYMFNSYETGRAGYVTILANYQPLQSNYGGPNFFSMDPEALYEIHLDTDGNAEEDITFQFRFSNFLNDTTGGNTGLTLNISNGDAGTKATSVPFINLGDVSNASVVSNRNLKEEYEVKLIRGNRRTGTATPFVRGAGPAGANGRFVKPLDYIGTKSFGSNAAYDTYAKAHTYEVDFPGCAAGGKKAKIFVGQRQEGFAVLLGNIFDLVNAPASALTDPTLNFPNPIGDKNVTTIALEVPAECVRKGATGKDAVVGGWATASVRQARVINPTGTFLKPSREGGPWTQVSRLGSPLVNEVVIGIKDKNKFNGSEPKDDGQFAAYVTNPTLPKVLEILFGPTVGAVKAPVIDRGDLVAAFLTGVDGVNQPAGVKGAEMLRLNTAIPATSRADQLTRRFAGNTAQLGAAGCFKPGASTAVGKVLDTALPNCDPAGFPNGRRPGDDVVDIALRVVMGYLLPPDAASAGDVPWGDAVPQNAGQFSEEFPYLNRPNPGAVAP